MSVGGATGEGCGSRSGTTTLRNSDLNGALVCTEGESGSCRDNWEIGSEERCSQGKQDKDTEATRAKFW